MIVCNCFISIWYPDNECQNTVRCERLLRQSLKRYQAIDSYGTTAIQCHAINQSKMCALGGEQALSHTLQAAAAG